MCVGNCALWWRRSCWVCLRCVYVRSRHSTSIFWSWSVRLVSNDTTNKQHKQMDTKKRHKQQITTSKQRIKTATATTSGLVRVILDSKKKKKKTEHIYSSRSYICRYDLTIFSINSRHVWYVPQEPHHTYFHPQRSTMCATAMSYRSLPSKHGFRSCRKYKYTDTCIDIGEHR